ncbi:hypothetical protein ACX0G9_16830 [Flavitalea flava]
MKVLSLLLIVCFSASASLTSAQAVRIREIKYRPKPEIYDPGDSTIIYPIIASKNPLADKLMNETIRSVALPSLDDEEDLKTAKKPFTQKVRKALRDFIEDGLSDLSYSVTFNRNNLLSLHVYVEESGGHHIVRNEYYFNFNIRTGEGIGITDLIREDKLDSFTHKLLQDKRRFLKRHETINLKNALKKKEISKDTYAEMIQTIDKDCKDTVQMNNFIITGKGIEIIDPCPLASSGGFDPDYSLTYSYPSLYPFLNPAFQKKIEK